MEIDKKSLRKIFSKLNVKETDGNRHVRGWVIEDGEALFPIHYSHAKPLNGYVAQEFTKSLHLSNRELPEFVKCTIPRETVIYRAKAAKSRDR